ncbi:SAC3/GANP family protein [Toxoplasma gondii VAND]|uniref:SAC3/GANP family protein n=2 Tax=Toxoplasma gondii TaxID=5811 RepID=A0A086QDY3_TOXGO|nr:SAC3/GANP family protein [Toxoplasma gondii VAND]
MAGAGPGVTLGLPGLWSPHEGVATPGSPPHTLGGAVGTDLQAGGAAGALFNPAAGAYMTMEAYLAYAYQQYTNHYYGIARQTAPHEVAMQQARECVEKLKASGFFEMVKTRYQATLAAAGSSVSTPEVQAPTPGSTAAPNTPVPLQAVSPSTQEAQRASQQGRVSFSFKLKAPRSGQQEASSASQPAAAPATSSVSAAPSFPAGPPGPASPATPAPPGPPGLAAPTDASAGATAATVCGAPSWGGGSGAIPSSSLPSYAAYYQQMMQTQQQVYAQQMLYQQAQPQPMVSAPAGPQFSNSSPYPATPNVYAPPMFSGSAAGTPPPPPPPLPGSSGPAMSAKGTGPSPGGAHAARIESAVEAAAKAAAAAVEAKHRSGQMTQGSGAGTGFDIASARDQALKRAAEVTKDIEQRRKQQLASTQAFALWLQKVHSTHLTGDKALQWRRTVNLFSQKVTNEYRLGFHGDRDWATYPVPSEEQIQSEVTKMSFQVDNMATSGKATNRNTASADPYASLRGPSSGRQNRRDSERSRESRSRSRSPVYGHSGFRRGRNERSASYRSRRHCQQSPADSWRDREDTPDDARSVSADSRGRTGEDDFISLTDKRERGLARSKSRARQVHLRREGKGERLGGAEAVRKDVPMMLIKCTPQEEQKRLQRMNRFGAGSSSGSTAPSAKENPLWKVSWTPEGGASPSASAGGLSWQEKLAIAKSTEKIVGTSTALEKNYLRLTNAPDPATVRPPEVLRRSFELILRKHREGASWRYVEEQFRSMRQDLTVQGVKDEFSRKVYETNGRLALSYHDLGQFNQCQTQLRDLYKRLQVPEDDPERLEYLCYRLVYMALQGMRLDVLRVMSEMTAAERGNSSVVYAMKVRRALADGNFRRYFYLASIGPHQTKHLCEIFEPRVRMLALVTLAKASLVLQPKQLQAELNFCDLQETMDFLTREGAVFNPDGKVDSKRSLLNFEKSSLLSKKVKAMG